MTSCMQVNDPKVTMKLTSKMTCCNKTISINIDDLDKIKEILELVHQISEERAKASTA